MNTTLQSYKTPELISCDYNAADNTARLSVVNINGETKSGRMIAESVIGETGPSAGSFVGVRLREIEGQQIRESDLLDSLGNPSISTLSVASE